MGFLEACAGKVHLDPAAGTWMTGFGGRTEPAKGVHDPITARAVLLDDGEARLCLVSCDLLGFEPAAIAQMRREIDRLSSIPGERVLICCTHTHSGPASMPMRGTMGRVDLDWLSEAHGKIADLVASLPHRTEPARFARASTVVSGVGYNRQDQSHPIDEELVVIHIESQTGDAIATIVNYALHPVVLGQGNLELSADFPGVVVRRLEEMRGGVGLYIQGACGDVDPVLHRDRGWSTGTFEDATEIGETLAAAAVGTLNKASATREVTLQVHSKSVEISLDPPPRRHDLSEFKRAFQDDRRRALADRSDSAAQAAATAMLDWCDELERASADGTVPRSLWAEIVVAAMNDVRLVCLPFETYADIGLRIKSDLSPYRALVAGCANGLYGYCPSSWAKEQGGYGPHTSCRWFSGLLTPLATGADDILIRESVALARSI